MVLQAPSFGMAGNVSDLTQDLAAEVRSLRKELLETQTDLAAANETIAKAAATTKRLREEKEDADFNIRRLEIDVLQANAKLARRGG